MSRERALLDRLVSWSPAILLGGLAALTYWLDAQVQPPSRRDGSARHDPDIYIENFRAVELDESGRIRESLTATRAQHYPDNDTVDFVAPSLSLTEPGKPKLSVAANAATLSGDREIVTFQGNVQATRDADPAGKGEAAQGPSTLRTDVLRVTPKKGQAETDAAVTIEDPRGIIHSKGLFIDNNSHTVKLKSAVSGTMQPKAISK